MAKISDEMLTRVLELQKQLLIVLDQAKDLEYKIVEQFGETEETMTAFEALDNITERLRNAYTRIQTLMLRIAEAQPNADVNTLQLLEKSIEQAEANLAASQATIIESKGDVGLL
ncbi:MAG: hypothetical protein QNJ08_20560 [Crocosphaera sp.]|nr:hypothetical protein [Crocosphaera sp.]